MVESGIVWESSKRAALIAASLTLVMLAGCADEAPKNDDEPVEVTAGLGVIRGVVVDTAIRPLAGAEIMVLTADDKTAVTEEDGSFVITDVEPGTHRVQAKHQLYLPANQLVDVVADVQTPQPMRFIMEQFVFSKPYMSVQKEAGFITCSLSLGGAASEECGEGVGDPSGNRIGKNPNNRAQIDFFVDSDAVRTIVAEQVWKANADGVTAQEFDTRLATEWSCTPTCGGNTLAQATGGSPLYLRVDEGRLTEMDITPETVFSTFTWPDGDAGVVLEQDFEVFITTFYHLPAPEGWSFVNGDPDPF